MLTYRFPMVYIGNMNLESSLRFSDKISFNIYDLRGSLSNNYHNGNVYDLVIKQDIVNGEPQADWLAPSFLPDAERDGAEGIILFDEITSAPRAVQAAAYQLILDRRIGEYVLPEGWRQVAAGNRAEDKGVSNRMPAPLANRMIHFELSCSLEDWKFWAIPKGIDYRVISFLNFRPELLYKFPNQASEIKAFPSPRSW